MKPSLLLLLACSNSIPRSDAAPAKWTTSGSSPMEDGFLRGVQLAAARSSSSSSSLSSKPAKTSSSSYSAEWLAAVRAAVANRSIRINESSNSPSSTLSSDGSTGSGSMRNGATATTHGSFNPKQGLAALSNAGLFPNSSTRQLAFAGVDASRCAAGQCGIPMRMQSTMTADARDGEEKSGSPVNSRIDPKAVEPQIAQMLYEDMLLGRMFEDKVAQLYFKGKVAGFVHLYNGQEAVSTGVIKALRDDDFVVSTYRDHVHALSKGVPAREVMAELLGKVTGCSKGRGGSMHMFSAAKNFVGGFAYIGEQVPVALGLAYAISYKRSLQGRSDPSMAATKHDQVTVVFTGDGSSNIGQFYESLNIAALAKLPIVFVVENNNWAIGMAHYRSTSVPEIYKKAPPFGIPSVEVDGMDVLAVRAAARQAIDRARRGEGPSLIEALTYRFRGHSVADPDELRAHDEKNTLLQRDPIANFESNFLKPNCISTDYLIKQTRQKIRNVIDDCAAFGDSSPAPCAEDSAEYVFAPHYRHSHPTGFDQLTDEEMAEYAEALRAELAQQAMSKAERKGLAPLYESSETFKIID